ncbi:MAG TPA: DUF4184 family protein [Kofleriaceae bacterium]|nr:DUF4184 family protein [Kofleriaceae bacterium]
MPFTPFHFGPGLVGKGLAPRWYSWTAFVASNVIIDVESLYYLQQHAYPVHRQLHTFLGAALFGLATAGVLLGMRRLLPNVRSWLDARSPTIRAEAAPLGIVVGAMVGALSHPVLDGLMHADIQPLQPWSDANPLLGLVGLEALHTGCMAAGVVGALLVLIWLVRERRGSRASRG